MAESLARLQRDNGAPEIELMADLATFMRYTVRLWDQEGANRQVGGDGTNIDMRLSGALHSRC